MDEDAESLVGCCNLTADADRCLDGHVCLTDVVPRKIVPSGTLVRGRSGIELSTHRPPDSIINGPKIIGCTATVQTERVLKRVETRCETVIVISTEGFMEPV